MLQLVGARLLVQLNSFEGVYAVYSTLQKMAETQLLRLACFQRLLRLPEASATAQSQMDWISQTYKAFGKAHQAYCATVARFLTPALAVTNTMHCKAKEPAFWLTKRYLALMEGLVWLGACAGGHSNNGRFL
jgi:hypothetical protein